VVPLLLHVKNNWKSKILGLLHTKSKMIYQQIYKQMNFFFWFWNKHIAISGICSYECPNFYDLVLELMEYHCWFIINSVWESLICGYLWHIECNSYGFSKNEIFHLWFIIKYVPESLICWYIYNIYWISPFFGIELQNSSLFLDFETILS
jgi:hypothetical protein